MTLTNLASYVEERAAKERQIRSVDLEAIVTGVGDYVFDRIERKRLAITPAEADKARTQVKLNELARIIADGLADA